MSKPAQPMGKSGDCETLMKKHGRREYDASFIMSHISFIHDQTDGFSSKYI